jgi:hypothetical protein
LKLDNEKVHQKFELDSIEVAVNKKIEALVFDDTVRRAE